MRMFKAAATAVGLSFLFATVGVAFAAQNDQNVQDQMKKSEQQSGAPGVAGKPGNKSGVATQPGDNNNSNQTAQDQAKKSEQQSGGPGVAGKPGGKNGPAAQPTNKD
jgi:hypothetical protein